MTAASVSFLSYIKRGDASCVSHPDVEQLELQGYRVISGLLEIYRPLLQLSVNEFSELVEQERVRRLPIESRLYQNFLPAIAWLYALKQSAD